MRYLLVCFAVVATVVIPSAAQAYYMTGQDLHRGLTLYDGKLGELGTSDLFDAIIAAGYVCGVFDTSNQAAFTSPSNLQRSTMIAVVLKWLKDNPATWTQPASILVVIAFVDAWGTEAQRESIRAARELTGVRER